MIIKSITAAVSLSVVTFLFGLVFVTQHAEAQGGVPLWTNRYYGPTNSYSVAKATAVDGGGNVFVTGYSALGNGSDFDYVTIKYSNAGAPLWTNRYAGPGDGWDDPCCIAVDSSGDVIVTGISDHSGGHTNFDYATIKYSSAGVPLWTNRYNGPANSTDQATSIAVDASGNVFVTGNSTDILTSDDYATIKYSREGVPLWTNRYNGLGNNIDVASAIAVDASGNVFVTGYSAGSGGAYDYDYLTIKYSNAGVPLWTNRYDGPANWEDRATDIAVDTSGNAIVTGTSGRLDVFEDRIVNDYTTIKYSNAGVTIWVKRFTHPSYDDSFAGPLAVATNGSVFVTGVVQDPDSGTGDIATVAYSSAGVPLWTNLFYWPGDDEPRGIAVDNSGNVFVTGYRTSMDTNSSTDAAIIAYSAAGVPLWSSLYAGPTNYWDEANAVAVDGDGNVFVTGSSGTSGPSSTDYDFVTIKYSSVSPSPVQLTIEPDTSDGFFLRFNGHPGVTYRLQRALSLTGPWSDLATNTAPVSSFIEYHETNPPAHAGFYRTVQP